ncbi:MAG: DNA-3-methyladenine glycosylase I [Hyphomicrobium sp.]|nr:DNA-3-methyladenine glycosylase I [Hyphomicrobium sp.]
MGSPSITRCSWPGIEDPLYARYHDTEWGVPLTDSQALFEKIVLEGFQAGLSWLTILRKRENFRRAFDQFDADKVAKYQAKDVTRLMDDAGIVRNLAKIEATIDNAKAYIAISARQSFASFIWSHLDGPPIQNTLASYRDAPSQTELSKHLSRSLKAEGFRFVGPTTVYAFMQSSGMTNDHLVTCPRHSACRKLQLALKVPIR